MKFKGNVMYTAAEFAKAIGYKSDAGVRVFAEGHGIHPMRLTGIDRYDFCRENGIRSMRGSCVCLWSQHQVDEALRIQRKAPKPELTLEQKVDLLLEQVGQIREYLKMKSVMDAEVTKRTLK